MSTTAVAIRETAPAPMVSDSVVSEYLASLGNKLTAHHRNQFTQICKAFNLNPFIREVYGIPYGDKFNIIVGYEVYLKRAERSGLLSGWRAWTEGDGKQMKGCLEIRRKDWDAPFYHEALFTEYDQSNSMWKSKPATMIKKVAIAQGFRMCFPEDLGGMPYTADEMPSATTDHTPHTQIPDRFQAPPIDITPDPPVVATATPDQIAAIQDLLVELCGDNRGAMAQMLTDVSKGKVSLESLASTPEKFAVRVVDLLQERIPPTATTEPADDGGLF